MVTPASSQQFINVVPGSVLFSPTGDTIKVSYHAHILSDTSLVAMDKALRQARADAAFWEDIATQRESLLWREAVLADSIDAIAEDTNTLNTALQKELKRRDVSWVEKLLWAAGGLVAGKGLDSLLNPL